MSTQSSRIVSAARDAAGETQHGGEQAVVEEQERGDREPAPTVQPAEVLPSTASNTARASSAGATRLQTLKTRMYQSLRRRIHSGTTARAITSVVSEGGRISTAVKMGASES